ncbi:glycoside hydrolase family 3 C-terminal domain-containing protein, partial [candidate division KSB1 bacterium]|nr:glycoside hydrolase family 3 C-terminal domain-containing protein [candidate division KSB1 bacterium]
LLYGIDAVHGHNNVKGAVIFPHNIGLGCTRNPDLVRQAAEITALEVAGTGINWTFAPCIAVPQNERWGRTYEGFGETADLTELMSSASVRGFQGDTLGTPQRILACAKHYLGDGGTTNGADQGNVEVDEATLRRIHLPGYIAAIEAGVGTVMASYNSWKGEKIHGHRYLLTTVLKEELGFKGFVVSDWAAIDQLPGDYNSDIETAINAGIDMVMVPERYREFISGLTTLVHQGKVDTSRINDAVRRILRVKFKMGLFETWLTDRSLTANVGGQAHREVARACVRQSLVLLTKKDGTLPLSRNAKRIHVAGNSADNLGYQCGGWTISWQGGNGAVTTGTTILQAIRAAAPGVNITYSADGLNSTGADIGVAVIGETPYAESQGDRSDLTLAASVVMPIRNMKLAGLPVVVVLISGRPMLLNNILPFCDAVVAAWLPGSEGGGVADVLFGDYAPTGTLSHSWPRNMTQIPVNFGDVSYDPLYPYGHGLTSFADSQPGSPPLFYAAATNEGGDRITVAFNKKMANPVDTSGSEWDVKVNGKDVTITQVQRCAQDSAAFVLILAAVEKRDQITVAYRGGSIAALDGGALAPFPAQAVYNLLNEAASLHYPPCRIEAEDYTAMQGVQSEPTSDAGGGLNVGWIDDGDYMDYSLAVENSGAYQVDLRVAALNTAGKVQLLNYSTPLATVDLPVTGGWQNWQTVRTSVTLPRGRHYLRVLAIKGGFNLNYMDFSLDTTVDDAGSQPCGYYLKSNYPNPFNEATTLTFGLAQDSRVRIQLYDIRGARAADVLDAYRPAGEHTIHYDARDLASGVYICRMSAGEYEAMIKVLAVK